MTDSLDAAELDKLQPSALEGVLTDLGWNVELDAPSHSIWATDGASVMVPRDRTFSDYLQRLHDAVSVIREIDPDTWRMSLPSLFAVHSDILRFRSKVETPIDGSVPLLPGVALIDSVPEVLRAGAKASSSTKLGYYAQRNHDLARQYLETARLGQTARGSFVVTVISRLPIAEVEDDPSELIPPTPPVPFQRVVNLQVTRALKAAGEAAVQYAQTSDFGVFQAAVDDGVSAELCGAAVGMLEIGGDIEFSFAPTLDVAISPQTDTRVVLKREYVGALATAHDEFRRAEPKAGATVRGTVELLNRAGVRGGPGTVALKVTGGDTDANKVRVRLEDAEYQEAINAHRDGRELFVTGRLEREGVLHWLYSPTDFRVGDVVLTKAQREAAEQESMF